MGTSPCFYDLLQTSLGWVGVLASPKGLRRVTVPRETPGEALAALGPELAQAQRRVGALEGLRQRLQNSFQGEEPAAEEALDLEGAPPFSRAVWEACRTIPRGETRSYAWLAAAAGRPGAARAVGQAMARNPIALLIPCHRVVRTDGSLGGYTGGLGLKAALLQSEGWTGVAVDPHVHEE